MSRFFVPADQHSPTQTLSTELLYPKPIYSQLPQPNEQIPPSLKPKKIVKKRENGEFLKASSYVDPSSIPLTSEKPKQNNREWHQAIISRTPPEKVLIQQNRHIRSTSNSPDEIRKPQETKIQQHPIFSQQEELQSIPLSQKPLNTIQLAPPPPKFFALQTKSKITGRETSDANLIAPSVRTKELRGHERKPIGSAVVLSGEAKQQIVMFSEQKRLQRVGSGLTLDRKRRYITWKSKEGNSIVEMPQLHFKPTINYEKEELKKEDTPLLFGFEELKPCKRCDFEMKVSCQSISVLVMENKANKCLF